MITPMQRLTRVLCLAAMDVSPLLGTGQVELLKSPITTPSCSRAFKVLMAIFGSFSRSKKM